ncbi:hypothetical protein BLOT_014107 [Blomia tropicalis]|nr:hypothetical protein BLOT_014107 [Blomia tropicalis]
MIDPFKAQAFMKRFGHTIRHLVIKPMNNFYSLFEFMKIMESYAQHYEDNPLILLKSFDFTFGCHLSNGDAMEATDFVGNPIAHRQRMEQRRQQRTQSMRMNQIPNVTLIGTGGKVLEALQGLMCQMIGLKHLSLRNLLLNPFEAQNLLDNVAINCCERLQTLTLINCCNRPYAFLATGIFLNLHTLVISCSHLSEDVLTLLADTKLNDLYIVQNEFTRTYDPISNSIWKRFMKCCNNRIRIHLAITHHLPKRWFHDIDNKKLILQPTRLNSIIFDSGYIPLRMARLMDISDIYGDNLECLAFYQLPKYRVPRSYTERVDLDLIHLAECCPRLNTLIIRELISTATLLIIVTSARNLTRLFVRRNALRKRFDCIRNEQWSDTFYEWLRQTSRSYEHTFQAVSDKLGYQWMPLTDDQFKRVQPDVRF